MARTVVSRLFQLFIFFFFFFRWKVAVSHQINWSFLLVLVHFLHAPKRPLPGHWQPRWRGPRALPSTEKHFGKVLSLASERRLGRAYARISLRWNTALNKYDESLPLWSHVIFFFFIFLFLLFLLLLFRSLRFRPTLHIGSDFWTQANKGNTIAGPRRFRLVLPDNISGGHRPWKDWTGPQTKLYARWKGMGWCRPADL